MRLNPPSHDLTATEERLIQEQIATLKAKLPPRQYDPREPIQAVVTKTFRDGASHVRPVDIGNHSGKVAHWIRDTIEQGGEVVVRPLYPDEQAREQKYYPGRERLVKLEEFVQNVANLQATGWTAADAELFLLAETASGLMQGKP